MFVTCDRSKGVNALTVVPLSIASLAAAKFDLAGLSIHTSGAAHPDKKEKEEEKEDMFQEILPASGALDTEQRAWRMILEDRINGQEEIIALLRE